MITASLFLPAPRLQNGVARNHKPTFSAPARPAEQHSEPPAPVGERIGNAMRFSVGNGQIQKVNLAHLSPPVMRVNSLDESTLPLVQDVMPSVRLKNEAERSKIAHELAESVTSQLKNWLDHPQKHPLWQTDLNRLLNRELNRKLASKGLEARTTVEADFHAAPDLQSQFQPARKRMRLYETLSYRGLLDGQKRFFAEPMSPVHKLKPVLYLGHIGIFLPKPPQNAAGEQQLKQQLQTQLEALLQHLAGEPAKQVRGSEDAVELKRLLLTY